MEVKTCSKCQLVLSIDKFQWRKECNKHRNSCKSCTSRRNKEYLLRTNYKPGENRLAKKKEANAQTFKMCSSCSINKPLSDYSYRTDSKRYRNQCKSCRNEYVKHIKKEDKHRLQANKRQRERRQTDPCFLMNQRLRARLRKVLISKNAKRLEEPYKLLGCSMNEFKQYIEAQFTDDMSWELRNFELDHKIPCAFFDLIDVDEQRKCFHYTNFQPLKSDANNLKRDFILEEHMDYLFSIMF